MPTKKPYKSQVSIRGKAYDRLRAYCRQHGVQMRTVVDDIINSGLDAVEKKAKEN